MRNGILGWEKQGFITEEVYSKYFVVCGKNITIKGANLYTFREKPVSDGIQICFRTLYMDPNVAPFCKSSQSHHKALYGRSQLNANEINMLVNVGKYFLTF